MYHDSIQFEFVFTDEELSVGGHVNNHDFDKARALLGAIAKILGFNKQTKPKVEDNFFDIGGDSLNMVQVIGACAELGYLIGMTEFALSPNLGKLVGNIRRHSEQNDVSLNLEKLDELKQASSGNHATFNISDSLNIEMKWFFNNINL